MNSKRDAYVHTRVTERELRTIDALARHLRRSRSDTMRVLALEKAEELGIVPLPPRPKPRVQTQEEEQVWNAQDAL